LRNIRIFLSFILGILSALEESAQLPEKLPVGGQAVIEGVLMRGRKRWALAVREENGNLFERVWPNIPWTSSGAWKLPVFRGLATMAEMMTIGFKALSLSAEVALGEEEQVSGWEMALTVGVALFFVIGLFVAFPVWLTDRLYGQDWGHSWGGRILEGLIRAAVFVSYIAIIGLWKDMRRVFEYHGAEHKTINAYESGLPLELMDSLRNSSRFHMRCGTSFLLVVVGVSILVFALAGTGPIAWRIGSRVLLLPPVIGISYEIIRGASRFPKAGKWIMFPTLWLQYLTTREPDEGQLGVALKALELALENNVENETAQVAVEG
jgi:uncharacterized protein YqhQ